MLRAFKSLVVLGALLLVTASMARAQSVASVTLDTKDQIIGDGAAVVVTGAITCTGTADVTAIVFQNHQGTSTAGTGDSGSITCTAAPQAFSLTVTAILPANGQYKGGQATVLLSAGDITLTAAIKLTN